MNGHLRDTDVAVSHCRVPDRDHAFATALLHQLALLVHVADADIPLWAPRADQRAVGRIPRRDDIGTLVLHMLYVLSSRLYTTIVLALAHPQADFLGCPKNIFDVDPRGESGCGRFDRNVACSWLFRAWQDGSGS